MHTLTTDRIGAALLLAPLPELKELKENETLVWTAYTWNEPRFLGCDAYLVDEQGKFAEKFSLPYLEDSGILLHLRTMDFFALHRFQDHSPGVELYSIGSQNRAVISILRTYIPIENQRDFDAIDR